MKKTILLSTLVILFATFATAQDSKIAAGIRFGPDGPAITSGFTVRYFLKDKTALEAMVGINNGLGICGTYQLHFETGLLDNLKWFAGAGAYIAFRSKTSAFGAAGIAGLDYKFQEIPLNISFDWKPELNILTSVGFEGSGFGLSARYIF